MNSGAKNSGSLNSGWTGGQYSVLRVTMAVAVLARMGWHISDQGVSLGEGAVAVVAVVAAGLLAAGAFNRIAAATLAGMEFADVSFFPSTNGILLVLLMMHVLVPPGPFGSWRARGRADPGGGWRMPIEVLLGACSALVLQFWYSGWAPFDTAELAAMLAVQAILWGPFVIRSRRADGTERLFYDGSCGLCHRTVRFALAEAPDDGQLVFSPLDSDVFRESVPDATQIPDSLVYVTADGDVLFRSTAVTRVLARLGGLWRLLGALLVVVPRPLRDLGYDGVAKIRYRVFGKSPEACPLIPAALRERFEF